MRLCLKRLHLRRTGLVSERFTMLPKKRALRETADTRKENPKDPMKYRSGAKTCQPQNGDKSKRMPMTKATIHERKLPAWPGRSDPVAGGDSEKTGDCGGWESLCRELSLAFNSNWAKWLAPLPWMCTRPVLQILTARRWLRHNTLTCR